jgi:hypothetical protein
MTMTNGMLSLSLVSLTGVGHARSDFTMFFTISQLIDHPEITPRDVRDTNIVHANEEEYMYMEGIR